MRRNSDGFGLRCGTAGHGAVWEMDFRTSSILNEDGILRPKGPKYAYHAVGTSYSHAWEL